RERLSLATPWQAEGDGARLLRAFRRRVERPVVGDDHLGLRELRAQRADRACDRLVLVARGDEDRQRLPHAPGVGACSILGSGASAVVFTPKLPPGAPPRRSASASRPDGLSTSSTVEKPG